MSLDDGVECEVFIDPCLFTLTSAQVEQRKRVCHYSRFRQKPLTTCDANVARREPVNLDDKLVNELKANEHIVHIVSVDRLIQAWERRHGTIKTGVGYASPVMDATLAAKLISEFGVSAQRVLLRTYAGRQYVISRSTNASARRKRSSRPTGA